MIEFPFPFQPYNIQVELMNAIFNRLEKGGVGIFESPTGTGKTQSIINSSLLWLKRYAPPNYEILAGKNVSVVSETNAFNSSDDDDSDNDEPAWVNEYVPLSIRAAREKHKRAEELWRSRISALLHNATDPNERLLKRAKWTKVKKKQARLKRHFDEVKKENEGLLLDERIASVNSNNDDSVEKDDDDEEFLVDFDEELNCVSSSSDDDDDDNDHDVPLSVRKVIYCSRTHSQLSQFMGEVRKTVFGNPVLPSAFSSLPHKNDNENEKNPKIDRMYVRCIALGSRKNLCVNKDVRWRSSAAINEKCLQMQRNSDKKSGSACGHFDKGSQKLFGDHAMIKIRDIEDLSMLGEEMGSCPYYGSRKNIPLAELVTVPYNMVLHRGTRKNLKLPLKGNIIIFDEAHNIIDAINNAYSCRVSSTLLRYAHLELSQYRTRYLKRLKGSNVSCINQLLYVLRKFADLIENSKPSENSAKGESLKPLVFSLSQFVSAAGADHINLFKLERYFERSKIGRKVQGFTERFMTPAVECQKKTNSMNFNTGSALIMVRDFLIALTHADSDARLLVANCEAKLVMLNAATHFQEIVNEAHAVLLLGGTMKPLDDIIQQLFWKVDKNDISTLSCDHVVPDANLLALAVSQGPTGYELNFTYKNRSKMETKRELGRLLANICSQAPGGVVIFLPSFNYAQILRSEWSTKGGLLERIKRKKKVFWEPRSAVDVEKTLLLYTNAIRGKAESSSKNCKEKRGAILFCVVGAKMSEGIDFKNELARCVIMIGLPFPPPDSPELNERMKWLDAQVQIRKERETNQENNCNNTKLDTQKSQERGTPGQEYYENICMRAVNQSIGRAIRHRNDFSSIILVDSRYRQERIQRKLPNWIQKRTFVASRYADVAKQLGLFYRHHRNK
eukprot:g4301.t1